ncbi:family 1 glycosylhydrolase [Sphingobacterium sp. E70]|nr:family 1 glycosylhydrolase [Sphingobacterium sp. E70]ULT24665.1 family 1 glycosylhydrolase [Sphingobacterium sp. E70]
MRWKKKGGWVNRDVKEWFGEFVSTCVARYGDRVKNWMVLNEPTVFTAAGYFFGVHAPERKGLGNFLAAAHHAALAQAHGARILKSLQPESQVGTTFSCSHVEPFTTREKDVIAAKKPMYYSIDCLSSHYWVWATPLRKSKFSIELKNTSNRVMRTI